MKEQPHFSITNTTKSTLPSVPFLAIKEKILGKSYDLSLAFIGETTSQKLNFAYRGKNKPTNVLSYSLSEKSGEIFITPSHARTEAADFDMSYRVFIAYLFIHGLLHLKGMDHGSTMDAAEEKLLTHFQLPH